MSDKILKLDDEVYKSDVERIKLIFEIFALAYLVQDKTKYCVFIDYSGHVDSFCIDIRESKDNWMKEACITEFKTRFENLYKQDEKDNLSWLKAKRDILIEILENEDIPYNEMTNHIEQIIHYKF